MISRLAIDLSLHQRLNHGSAVLRVYPLPGFLWCKADSPGKAPRVREVPAQASEGSSALFAMGRALLLLPSPSFVLRPPIHHEPLHPSSTYPAAELCNIGASAARRFFSDVLRRTLESRNIIPPQVSKPKLSGRGGVWGV